MKKISAKNRRVENIHTAEFVPFLSEGKEDGAVLQLKSAKPLGVEFYIYKMGPGTKTIAHKHKGAEEFLIIEDDLTDHNGVNYGPNDLVWLWDETKHYSYTENGC
jgi:anti-sigma factor ChrR (cupin superfamily)